MGSNYILLGQYEESLVYLKKYFNKLKILGGNDINYMHRIGYAYWKSGRFDEADYYFDKQIETCKGLIALDRPQAQNESIYSAIVILIKNDPLFNSIRGE